MPNHITNRVKFKSDDRLKVEAIMQKIASPENPFDFNQIIPMPKELVGTTSPAFVVEDEKYQEEYAKYLAEKDKEHSFARMPITRKMQVDYLNRFGADSWYEWSLKNWDTKWNSYSHKVEGDTITFETAWSHPDIIIRTLSEMFPDVTMEVEFADEDIGSNLGKYYIVNGEAHMIPIEDEERFAIELNGYDYDEYMKERVEDEE